MSVRRLRKRRYIFTTAAVVVYDEDDTSHKRIELVVHNTTFVKTG